MSKPIPKSNRPLPYSTARLFGSVNHGAKKPGPTAIIADHLQRVSDESDAHLKRIHAQRTVGALMALIALGKMKHDSYMVALEMLATLTGETSDGLVTMAGVAL